MLLYNYQGVRMSLALREKVDIKEDILFNLDKELLEILLKDRTSIR